MVACSICVNLHTVATGNGLFKRCEIECDISIIILSKIVKYISTWNEVMLQNGEIRWSDRHYLIVHSFCQEKLCPITALSSVGYVRAIIGITEAASPYPFDFVK